MNLKSSAIIAMLAGSALLAFGVVRHASAATKYWDGGGADANWNTSGNWNPDGAPGTTDVATFDGTCISNCSPTINVAISVQGIDINAGYGGTITQAAGVTVTLGTSGYDQATGTFTGGDSAIDINDGAFNLTGGTFTNSSGGLTIERNFTVNGGTFTNIGKTVTFDGAENTDDSTITCTGSLGGTVVFSKTGVASGADITVALGCSISLGTSPTSTLHRQSASTGLINNGTITIASGTWTVNSNLPDAATYSITNNGTINHTGASAAWDINDGELVNNSGATINYSGTAIAIERNFTQNGTFDLSGVTVTLDGITNVDDSTITCTGSLGGTVVFSKAGAGFGADITVALGCSISLGANPTSTLNRQSASTGLINNGTITIASGTWTVNNNLPDLATYSITNNGTINHTGASAAWDINDGGLVNNSGATINYSGTAIAIERNFTQSGTFDLSAVTVTLGDSNAIDDSTITCTGTLGGTVVVTKNSDGDFIVAFGCSISLGASPTTTIDFTAPNSFDNNGTVTISSGTWTVTGTGGGNINNDGTITHSGTGWDINDAGFLNNSGATTTYTGTTMSIERNFTQNGTFDLSAVTVTLDGADDSDDTTLTCGAALGALTINKSHASGNTTLGSHCTVAGAFTRTNGPLSNPASAYTLTAQGDFSMSTTDTFGGANLTLTMGGGNNQTITQNAGTISGPFKVDKSGNVASIASGLNLATGSTCNVVEGIFSINGRTFTCGSTFTVEDGGTLQRFGTSGEVLTTPTLNSGSTAIYTGDGDSAADTVTITTMATTYHHLIINSTDGATDTFQLGVALDVNGLLTLTAGTFSVGAGNNGITVGGGWTDTGAGTFTEGAGTVTFDGTGTINSNEAFNNVIVNGSGITATVATNSLQVGGTLQATLGILDMNGIGATITGLTTVNGGTLQAGTATQTYNGGFTVSSGTFTGSSGTVDVNGTLTISGGTFTAPSSAGNLAIFGDFTISSAPTFTHNSGTVTFDGASAAQTFTTNGVTLNNLTMNLISGIDANDNLVFSGALDIDGVLTITDGELKLDTNNPNVNLAGNLSVASPGTITKGTGIWTFDGSGTATVDSRSQDLGAVVLGTSGKTVQLSGTGFAPTTFALSNGTFNGNGQTATFGGLVTVSGGTYTASTATQTFNAGLTVNGGTFTGSSGTVDINNTLTISSGTFTAPSSSGSLLLSGNLAISGSPTFTHNSGTFTFDAGSGTQTLNSGGVSFNNISHSGAGTLQLITNPVTIGGTFTNSVGTYDANGLATTVTGLATVSGGIYTAGTATQKFDGGLTVSGGTFTGSSGTVDVNGALTVSSGVFTAPSSSGTFTVSGNFDHSGGTFTHNSGTVTLDGGSQSILGSSTFNNLTKNVASAATLTFGNGTTQTFVGAMNLKGAASNLLSLRSSVTDSQWRIDPQSTRTIEYLNVKDSNNINATAITTQGFNITDAGGNTGWTFNTDPTAPSSLGPSSLVNGSWTNDSTPTLTFSISDPDIGDTVRFRIQIDDTSDFSSVVTDYTSALQAQGSATFTVGQAAGSGTYTVGSSGQTLTDSANSTSGFYWRALATDNTGASSAYTTAAGGAIAFKLDTAAPGTGSITFGTIATTSIVAQAESASDALSGLSATPYNFEETTLSASSGAQSGTSWTHSGLNPNVRYTYRVTVTDTAGNSAISSSSNKYTIAAVPSSLSGIANSGTQITISWNANGNAGGTEYYAENTTISTNSGWITATSWASTGLTCSTSYSFRGKARNGDGTETAFSSSVFVSTSGCNANVPGSFGPASLINGSWTNDSTPTLTFSISDPDIGDTVRFRIQIDDTSDFLSPVTDYTSALQAQGAASFTVGQAAGNGLYTTGSAGQTLSDSATSASGYYFRVRSIDNSGNASEYSAANNGAIAFKMDTTSPLTSSITFGSIGTTSIVAQAESASDALSGLATTPYNFEETTLSASSGAQSGTSWTHSSLSPNVRYTYRVTVTDTAGNSATSSSSNKYTLAAVPASLSGTANSATQITASWNANGNHDGTEYYIENSANGNNSGWTTVTNWTFANLNCSTQYPLRVKARNSENTETAFTDAVSVSTKECGMIVPPSSPGSLFQPEPMPEEPITPEIPVEPVLPSKTPSSPPIRETPIARLPEPPLPPSEIAPAPKEIKKTSSPPSFLEQIPKIIEPFIPPIFRPVVPPKIPPVPSIKDLVPSIPPPPLVGKWRFLSVSEFVFAPLPQEFKTLSEKFPEFKSKLTTVGVTRFVDLTALKATALTLPSLERTIGQIPVAELQIPLNAKIPTDIVFAHAGGIRIELPNTLNLSDLGKPEQTITTVARAPLNLVVKPDKPVSRVKGYIVFKSRKPRSTRDPLNLNNFFQPFFPAAFAKEDDPDIEQEFVLIEFEYTDPDGDGIFTANVAMPSVPGEYEIITVMDYEAAPMRSKEIRMITVVDPEGYVYEKIGSKEARVSGAIVTLYWLNSATSEYERFPAEEFDQENPQVTEATGHYSFLVPEGSYYIKVETPGYLVYQSKTIQVAKGGGIHLNIELKTRYWWLSVIDWKTAVLIIVASLLLYNFYRDRTRDRFLRQK